MQILEKFKPLGLLCLRLSLGVIFFYNGYQKLFVGKTNTLAEFQHLGLPPYMGTVIGVLELFGAILLVFGLLTRLTALLLAAEMGFVLVRVRIPQIGIYAVPSYALPLLLCGAAFALATVGAGLISIDAATFERTGKARTKSKSEKRG